MSRTTERVFYILTWLFQGSSYLSPRAYGVLHRLHHAHADTALDPHSPKYDNNLFHMMWKTKNVYSDVFYEKTQLDSQYTKNVPDWRAMDDFADGWFNRIFWMVIYTAFYFFFAEHWYQWLLLPIQFVMGPFHGAIINWFAHKYGYRNHELEDTSRNLWFPDLIMWGEGFHNNHHKFPARSNFGTRWYEFDPMYPLIRIFDSVGLIHLVAKPAVAKQQK